MVDGLHTQNVPLIDRVKGMILRPNEEWPRIAGEQASQGEILRGYVLPLALIGPVAHLIGSLVFGRSFLFVTSRPGVVSALVTAIITYIVAIVAIYVLSLIADFLAPKFDGKSNRTNAFKLVAYGATAAWVAQIFYLVPALSFFAILGVYSLYLFYTGATPLMAVPEDKRIGYTAVTFLCAFVLNLLVGLIAGAIVGLVGLATGGSALAGMDSDDDVTVSIPGVGSVNTRRIEEQAARMEKIQEGEIKAVPTDTLKAMLPQRIGSFERTGFSATAMGQAGSGVEGEYKAGDYQFDLKVQDMLALSGLAGIGSAMGIEQEREDENGYERIGTVDGQWREESWRNSSGSGTYAKLIAGRFRVEASGRVEDIEVLKSAVGALNEGKLEALAE